MKVSVTNSEIELNSHRSYCIRCIKTIRKYIYIGPNIQVENYKMTVNYVLIIVTEYISTLKINYKK